MQYSIIRIKDENGEWYNVYTGEKTVSQDFAQDYARIECEKFMWDFCEVNVITGMFDFQPAQFLVDTDEVFEYIYEKDFDVDYTPDHLLI
jgi:hypothetical protein